MLSLAGRLHDGVRYEFVPEKIDEPEQVEGELRFSPPVKFNGIRTVDFVDILGSDMDAGIVEIRLNESDSTKKSLHVKYNGGGSHLPLFSGPVYYAVSKVLEGELEGAQRVIYNNYSGYRAEWNFRNDCRDTLQFDDFLLVLNTLSGESDQFSHVQFRSVIGYFAKRILDTVPSAIHSFEELEERIQKWNQAENLKPVDLSEVLGEKLGRDYHRDGLSDERKQLLEIGFDPVSYDPDWSTVVPACWMAHLVLTEGLKPAKEYAEARPTPVEQSYEDLKSAASNAGFGDRGELWGRVVAHPNNEDFRFDAFNYVRWMAHEYYGKAKLEHLLLGGAKELAPPYLSPTVPQKLVIQKQISIGHYWRRDSAFTKEKEAFEKARNLATGELETGHEPIPDLLVDAEAGLAHARANQRGGSKEEAVDHYQEAIDEIQRIEKLYDIRPKKIENQMKFLEEQIEKMKTKA